MTEQEQKDSRLSECIELICKKFNVPASLKVSDVFRDRTQHNRIVVFLDINTACHFSIEDKEVLNNLKIQGIRSKYDYRKLHSLVRSRLINAVCQIRNLTEESLRNLGAKV